MNINLPKGGRVIGIGTDLVECDRIAGLLERQGESFLQKVFTPEERAYCERMKNPAPYFAARFAAKEAVSKCFTTGIGEHLDWKSIAIHKGEREEPRVILDDKGKKLLAEVGGSDVLITLSHTEKHGLAFAVLVALE